jgi:hypothetical protein
LEQAAEVAGKSAIEVAAAGQRLSTPPPPPAMSSEPFPGWGHPELMKQFQEHLKSIGFHNHTIVKQFAENRNAMRDSSGEHVSFAGIKRKVPAKKTSSVLKAKKKKSRPTKRRKKCHGDGGVKKQERKEVPTDSESASGTRNPLCPAKLLPKPS